MHSLSAFHCGGHKIVGRDEMQGILCMAVMVAR